MIQNPWLERVHFGPDGLVPVVVQEARHGALLMVAWANAEALEATLRSGLAHYYSRSRQALWQKGETSGHHQRLVELRIDCDGDALLYRVTQEGPACHTGQPTCFFTRISSTGEATEDHGAAPHLLLRLARTIARRAAERPEGSYTADLLTGGIERVSQKVGEEAVELVVAATAQAGERVAAEAADLLYHLLVLLEARRVPLDAVLAALEAREQA